MSKTSLNAKCGIELKTLVLFKMSVHESGYTGTFSSANCPNETDILKLEQLKHQMTICIYKADLIWYDLGSWTLLGIFCFSGCWISGHEFRIPDVFKCLKYWKTCNFTLRWLLDLDNTSLAQNLRLKTLVYLLFIPAIYFFYLLFGCPMANLWLLWSKQSHSTDVNHCIWAINFWLKAGVLGDGSLHLTEFPVSFDHNAITPQIAENTLPRLKSSFSKMWKCPQYPKQV